MAKFTVTVVDTTGIQSYVFGSNRLQENIGASELVRLATEQWALDAVAKSVATHNLRVNEEHEFVGWLDNDEFQIEKAVEAGQLDAAEVVYCGGGNTVILFSQAESAREYAWKLTSKVLRDAPGLSLVIEHDFEFDWDESSKRDDSVLAKVVTRLLNQKLAAHKASRLPSQPTLGLGVTAACQSTGLPAIGFNGIDDEKGLRMSAREPTQLISREIKAKLKARNQAIDRLKLIFKPELGDWYEFPVDIDDLGRISGEESYVAVVHADGNGMGDRIKAIAADHLTSRQNRSYINKLRSFSRGVKEASDAALREIVGKLVSAIKPEDDGREYVSGRVPLKQRFLPFRSLVLGGDDLTFVCNGLLGISLAVEYLKAYEKYTEKHDNLKETLYASAGVAIVKMHYPFARAYALSEELAKSAKAYARERELDPNKPSPAALDWHIATSGLSGSLDAIRSIEYERPDTVEIKGQKTKVVRSLLARPLLLRLAENDQEGRSWCESLETVVKDFQKGKDWRARRNKVKDLREMLREGLRRDEGGRWKEKEVEEFRLNHDLPELPEIKHWHTLSRKNGWDISGRCGYFDAVELCDYFVELKSQSDQEPEENQ